MIAARARSLAALACLAMLAAPTSSTSKDRQLKPDRGDPAEHSYPLLGASAAEVAVPVHWNRLYDHEGLGKILAELHDAFPRLTRLYSIGRSWAGRDIWCLEVSNRDVGDPARKPGMYIDGNIHGNEAQGGEAVAYTAWYLLHQYGHIGKVTELVDERVFYLIPTINPDGRDHWLQSAHTPHSSRTGVRPRDNDRDGLVDEDGPNDLNGDGHITMMRRASPEGRWKPNPDWPNHLMDRAEADEPGSYEMLGWEGHDDDGDGRVNEDGLGGYDPNRDWAWDWQPWFIQYGAQNYPFFLPESRAVKDFVIARPNIAAMQSYHNSGGMILRGPGREGGKLEPDDDRVMQFIAGRGEKMLPFYRSMVLWKDLYPVWGGEFDWFYGGRGILAFSNELWSRSNLFRDKERPSSEDRAAFMRYVLMGDGIVEWEPYEHPTYGAIEIGGTTARWGRMPPSFLLEEECHRNMAFTLYHAEQMPRLAITEVVTERIDGDVWKVWVAIENSRLMASRTAHERNHMISPPDVVSLRGVEVLAAGRVTDKDFARVEPVERRPERVELDAIEGMSTARVQFLVRGSGRFEVTVDSAKGGLLESEATLTETARAD